MPPKKQVYIPGLNARPDDDELPPHAPRKTDMDYLLDDFLEGRKNPTMCLYEFCAVKKLALQYKEEPVVYRPGMPSFGSFGYRALVEELAYPQGVASSKKDAKNEASKFALRVLFGLDEFVAEKHEPQIVDDFQFIEVRSLSDICQEKKLAYDKVMTRDMDRQFICTVIVANYEPCIGRSLDRGEAVVQAHAQALVVMGAPIPLGSVAAHSNSHETNCSATTPVLDLAESRVPDPKNATLRENITYKVLQNCLQSLPPEFSSFGHNIAAIFIASNQHQGYEGAGKIVAFGSGSNTITVESLTLDGRCVIDSTCIVTARRAFKRYLAQEMINCYSNSQTSIFERRLDDLTRLKLKKGFSVHLYVSHPIDGDYKESLATPSEFTSQQKEDILGGAHYPNFDDRLYGQLRCKNEQGMVEMTEQTPEQTSFYNVMLANEMWVMSASDKLLRWNILGLQGAAFTHFMDPIYLSSVSLGYNPNNDYGHLSRAVCCRVYNSLGDSLPQPYMINHPALCFVESKTQQSLPYQSISQDSLNWNCYDKKVELTEGLTGKNHKLSPFQVSPALVSRQCKAGQHFKWFRDLCSQDGGHRIPTFANKSPLEAKVMAKTYQAAKKAFMHHFLECGIGKWIHAPSEISMFTK